MLFPSGLPRGKRVFDLLAAGLGLLILSPLLLLIAALVRMWIGAPVLFRQARAGYRGAPFFIYKFRTMTEARGPDGGLLPDAQRLTRLGNWLRGASLDELPELLNVLRGEMSLVGPRPLLPEYLPLYSAEQARRHDVYPGLTGWAQVNGRNALTWADRFRLDLWYVANRSFGLDLKILLLTLWVVVRGAGISHPGSATMERFTGSN
jgi:lipopolysaccharide/colanic/teichoic acid biosynthesis glycosyltransferase